MSDHDDHVSLLPEPDYTEALAQTVGVSVWDLIEVLGAEWHLLPDGGDDSQAGPSGSGDHFGQWFASGVPFQLALRLTDGGIEVGVPGRRWAGAHTPVWHVHNRCFVPGFGQAVLTAARPVVAEALKKRRSAFRYCRYCRRQTPPEGRNLPDVCFGCATMWLGHIY